MEEDQTTSHQPCPQHCWECPSIPVLLNEQCTSKIKQGKGTGRWSGTWMGARRGRGTGTGRGKGTRSSFQIQATIYRSYKWNFVFNSNKQIFFLETSSKDDLDSRQACSVESAARANPDWAVSVLLLAHPGPGPITSPYRPTLAALASLPNVFLKTMNATDLVLGTPVESLFANNTLKDSKYTLWHTSDVLRMVVLRKYGGVYLDLDVIVVKSFNRLPRNFVAKEIWYELANGALGAGRGSTGRLFVDTALRELSTSALRGGGVKRTGFGAEVLLRTMYTLCGTAHVNNMTPLTCQGVHILDSQYFYPIPYERWYEYYDEYVGEGGAGGAAAAYAEEAYAHHTWGALGANASVHRHSLLARLARDHCPTVYALYGDHFGAGAGAGANRRKCTRTTRPAQLTDSLYEDPCNSFSVDENFTEQ